MGSKCRKRRCHCPALLPLEMICLRKLACNCTCFYSNRILHFCVTMYNIISYVAQTELVKCLHEPWTQAFCSRFCLVTLVEAFVSFFFKAAETKSEMESLGPRLCQMINHRQAYNGKKQQQKTGGWSNPRWIISVAGPWLPQHRSTAFAYSKIQ